MRVRVVVSSGESTLRGTLRWEEKEREKEF
jgi:hypothetical protein